MKRRARGLIIFTRYPDPGGVKTRLIPLLGAEGAAELQHEMTSYTLAIVDALQREEADVEVVIRFAGGTRAAMARLYGANRPLREQGDGDLGARLQRAVDDAFNQGTRQVVIIGSDCPQLTPALLQAAFDALESADLAIGPARDGGYYLIGLRRPCLDLFTDIPWGSGNVLEMTLSAARRAGLKVKSMLTLQDVDRPQDLEVWQRIGNCGSNVRVIT